MINIISLVKIIIHIIVKYYNLSDFIVSEEKSVFIFKVLMFAILLS